LDLAPVAPNPVRTEARIRYRLTSGSKVRVTILDTRGHVVATLEDGYRTPGEHVARWAGVTANGTPAPPGVYVAHVQAVGFSGSRHLVLVQ
jgi:flagellar hook assembly protein FlgD